VTGYSAIVLRDHPGRGFLNFVSEVLATILSTYFSLEPLQNRTFSSGVSLLVGVLLLCGIAWTQVRLGGTRPAYAYPGYLLVTSAGLLSAIAIGVKRPRPNWGVLLWTTLFFGYLLVRGFLSPLPFLATANGLLILVALTTYSLSAVFLTAVRTRLLLIGGFLLLEVGHLWVGLTQYISGNNLLPFDFVRPDYGSRASGFYVCPNHLAGFLETLALVLLAIALFGRVKVWLRVILIYFACAGFVGVMITGSRGGYLSSGIGLVVLGMYGAYHLKRVGRVRFDHLFLGASVGCVALLLGFTFVTHSDLLTKRFGSIIEPRDVRPRLWQAGMRALALNPVVGTGAGTYLVFGRKFRDLSVQTDPVYAHNDYVQLLAEYGIVAGALLVGFLAAHLVSAWNFVQRMLRWLQQNEKMFSSSLALVVGAAAAIVALVVHSIFDFNLQIPANTLFVALLFGILANPGAPRESKGQESLTWVWSAIPFVLSLILIGLISPRWRGESEAEAARLAFLKHSYIVAVYHARQAAEYGNEDPDTFYYLAESRRQLANTFTGANKHDFLIGAVEAFNQGLTYFPMDERSLVKGGLTYAELGDFSNAEKLFARAFDWDPNLGQIYAFYGAFLELEGRNDEAAKAYRHSNELSANQIATAGLQQILETAKTAP
jgi:O-antigen ligase